MLDKMKRYFMWISVGLNNTPITRSNFLIHVTENMVNQILRIIRSKTFFKELGKGSS